MSINFTSNDATSASAITIGGQSASTKGVVGPFPRYSISRENLTLEDGTHLNARFNITVTGTATMKTGDPQNVTTQGQRQNTVQGEAIILAQLNREEWPLVGTGTLEITPYGGGGNSIKFGDAKILSIELLEQGEGSAGIQYQEYVIQFEAFEDESTSSNTGKSTLVLPTYNLTSASESWDFGESDQRAFADNKVSNDAKKTFTLSHTVSATGIPDLDDSDKPVYAWNEAKSYVIERLVSDPLTIAMEPLEGLPTNSDVANLKKLFEERGYSIDDWGTANHVRAINSSVTTGEYSVTDTWVVLEKTANATVDIEFTFDTGEQADLATATVSGTITGLNTNAVTNATDSKFTNAESAWTTIQSDLFNATKAQFLLLGTGTTLKNAELTKNVGKNKTTGTITFSVAYNDVECLLTGCIEESLQEDYSGGTDVVAVIGIILRAIGPVIQDMGTITEKRKSVTFTAKMKKAYRGTKPDGETIVDEYKPTASATGAGPYNDAKQETWNKMSGEYTLTKEWVYT